MRYVIVSKGMKISQIETEAKKVGGQNINQAKILSQVFCDLDEEQVKALVKVPGLAVKPVREYHTDQVLTVAQPVETVSDVFYLLRSYFTPPLTGTGLTVAVLDNGIRKSHRSLQGKVIYEANYSGSLSADDVFGHGTQISFMVAGDLHAIGEKAGVSPGASLYNVKVINDEVVGTDEGVILGIDKVCNMAEEARRKGLFPTDELYPNVINISFGSEDDGDPDNPVRIAYRQASQEYGLDVVAATGNFGPRMTTVTLPACDPEVIAVGAIETLGDIVIWDKSSR
jgi:serine protease AprX